MFRSETLQNKILEVFGCLESNIENLWNLIKQAILKIKYDILESWNLTKHDSWRSLTLESDIWTPLTLNPRIWHLDATNPKP